MLTRQGWATLGAAIAVFVIPSDSTVINGWYPGRGRSGRAPGRSSPRRPRARFRARLSAMAFCPRPGPRATCRHEGGGAVKSGSAPVFIRLAKRRGT